MLASEGIDVPSQGCTDTGLVERRTNTSNDRPKVFWGQGSVEFLPRCLSCLIHDSIVDIDGELHIVQERPKRNRIVGLGLGFTIVVSVASKAIIQRCTRYRKLIFFAFAQNTEATVWVLLGLHRFGILLLRCLSSF